MITNQPNIQELEKDVILLPEETSTGLTDNKQQEVEEEAIDENKSYDVMAENQQELNPSTEKLLANSYYFKLIASLPPTHTPAFKPKGGVQYLYEAETLYKIDGTNILLSLYVILRSMKQLIDLINFYVD